LLEVARDPDLAETLADDTIAQLASIHTALGGEEPLLTAKRRGSNPRPDFVLAERRLLVEVDELQHFTTERLHALELYPATASLAYDVEEYLALARRWAPSADRYRAAKTATDFPFPGGRRAQRAYFDSLRDLAAASFGLSVLRVPAPECDGKTAYSAFLRSLERIQPAPVSRSTA
jgi:hypothetical protein